MNRLEIAKNISTNIERERIKLGMSQAQFAKALDMSLSTYKRIANGESSRIDIYTAYEIAPHRDCHYETKRKIGRFYTITKEQLTAI